MLLYLAELIIVTVYCNSLLYGVPNCHLRKLQRVQYAAACLIFEESTYCYVTPLLKSLHWLPVKYRIIFKVLLITFKAIHGLSTVYISELILIRDVSLSRYCLRSLNSLMLNYPALKSRKTLGDRSFSPWPPPNYETSFLVISGT